MVEFTIETAAVGIVGLVALNLASRALLHLYKTFLRPGKNLKRYGKWAVITGATGKCEGVCDYTKKIWHRKGVKFLTFSKLLFRLCVKMALGKPMHLPWLRKE
jgi:hypothetical protein